ncbi:MAG: XdhC family protein [bacterium]
MKEVIEEAVRLLEKKEPFVLATLVRTQGMTPQKAGVKQLIRQDGSSIGTLGGGCVEGDIWFYAKEMLREKNGPQYRDYNLNEDISEKDGMVCGGTATFFLELFCENAEFLVIAKEIVSAYQGGPAISVATIVSQNEGENHLSAKLLIREDGSTLGSLGMTHVQEQAIRAGRKVATVGENICFTTKDGTTVYVEGFTTPPALVILGGGHVGKAVYHLAVPLGFRIFMIDDRPEFCTQERFPLAVETLVDDFDKALQKLDIHFNTFILIATRGHRLDDISTFAAVKTAARYIGLLGSRRKNLMIFRDLQKQGVSPDRIKEIHAPVGLDIGARSPEEIAVSILAEIILCLRGGTGQSLKKHWSAKL